MSDGLSYTGRTAKPNKRMLDKPKREVNWDREFRGQDKYVRRSGIKGVRLEICCRQHPILLVTQSTVPVACLPRDQLCRVRNISPAWSIAIKVNQERGDFGTS